MSSEETRYFWLTWDDHVIQLGKGLVPGSGGILSYTDPHKIVFGGVSVSSDDGFDADWETVGATSGNAYSIRTPDEGVELQFRDLWMIPDMKPLEGN